MAIVLNVAKKALMSKPAQVVYATAGMVVTEKVVSPAVDWIKLPKDEKKKLAAAKKQAKMEKKMNECAKKAMQYGIAAGKIQAPVETHLDNEALDVMSEAQQKTEETKEEKQSK